MALGVLTLLAEVASAAPLVCAVDDVQWLDPESVVALGFVARRLYAERVVLLFAVREPTDQLSALVGLPELAVGGLDDDAALELLASLAPGRLSRAVAARIITGTGGNPLALAELARELSPAQLAGAELLPEPLPAGGSLEQTFGRRVQPAAARDAAAAGGGGGRADRLAGPGVARGQASPYRSGRGNGGRSGRPGRDRLAGRVPASPGPFGRLLRHPAAAAAADS